jgi:hypothetical protein
MARCGGVSARNSALDLQVPSRSRDWSWPCEEIVLFALRLRLSDRRSGRDLYHIGQPIRDQRVWIPEVGIRTRSTLRT